MDNHGLWINYDDSQYSGYFFNVYLGSPTFKMTFQWLPFFPLCILLLTFDENVKPTRSFKRCTADYELKEASVEDITLQCECFFCYFVQ